MWTANDRKIALKPGFTNDNNQRFDPKTDAIDLGQYTISIDSKTTNFLMFNFYPENWTEVQEVLRQIPLTHPFWDPHESLGERTWSRLLQSHLNNKAVRRPEPEAEFTLIPGGG